MINAPAEFWPAFSLIWEYISRGFTYLGLNVPHYMLTLGHIFLLLSRHMEFTKKEGMKNKLYLVMHVCLKGQCHEIFSFWFFS